MGNVLCSFLPRVFYSGFSCNIYDRQFERDWGHKFSIRMRKVLWRGEAMGCISRKYILSVSMSTCYYFVVHSEFYNPEWTPVIIQSSYNELFSFAFRVKHFLIFVLFTIIVDIFSLKRYVNLFLCDSL